jgi:hypothetical protein
LFQTGCQHINLRALWALPISGKGLKGMTKGGSVYSCGLTP